MGNLLAPAQITSSRSSTSGRFQIRSLSVTGGFMDGAQFAFSGGLNCIIGARGTGKTTVLELIRFVLDVLPDAPDPERYRIESLVKANLGDGTAELVVETRDGLVYRILRTATEPPTVVTADGAATEITLKSSGSVFRPNIYSQNQIERVAEESQSQLFMLDHFDTAQIAAITAEIRTVTAQLSTNGSTLIPLSEQIGQLSAEIAGLPAVEEQLKALIPPAGQNAERLIKAQQAKSLRQREASALDGLWGCLQAYDQQLADLEQQIPRQLNQYMTRELVTGPNASILGGVKQQLVDGAGEVEDHLRKSRSRVARMVLDLSDAGQALSSAHGEQEAVYQDLVKQDSGMRAQATERNTLERLKNDLESKQRHREQLVERKSQLMADRTRLLQKLSELRDHRYALRAKIAKYINSALQPTIHVTIEQAGHSGDYRALLEETLRGARMKQGIVAQRISDHIAPGQLVQLIRKADVSKLARQASLNDDQARRTLEALNDEAVLQNLETIELADKPRVELRDGAQYKESAALSTGQKCTTVLPIILLDSDVPLLIDQPEDNLDNRFICESVVQSIQKVKQDRQLIFVTHNPNIPVLADAERIFVLESDGSHSRLMTEGPVDTCREAIVNLLEGGEQAFKRRRERYAY